MRKYDRMSISTFLHVYVHPRRGWWFIIMTYESHGDIQLSEWLTHNVLPLLPQGRGLGSLRSPPLPWGKQGSKLCSYIVLGHKWNFVQWIGLLRSSLQWRKFHFCPRTIYAPFTCCPPPCGPHMGRFPQDANLPWHWSLFWKLLRLAVA